MTIVPFSAALTSSRCSPDFPPILNFAVMLFVSGLLLLYSAVVVPFQICMWDYSDPCNTFPTLHLDIAVDTFFLASSQ